MRALRPGLARSARVIFSGDLGAPHAPLLPAPRPPWQADVLVLETTYGDRNHEIAATGASACRRWSSTRWKTAAR